MAVLTYENLLKLIEDNPEYINYDEDISPKSNLVIIFDESSKCKNISDFSFAEGSILMDTGSREMIISGSDKGTIKSIEFN
ncbi:MAG: hypothetical protein ACK5K7_01825 [Bacilli bacterium]